MNRFSRIMRCARGGEVAPAPLPLVRPTASGSARPSRLRTPKLLRVSPRRIATTHSVQDYPRVASHGEPERSERGGAERGRNAPCGNAAILTRFFFEKSGIAITEFALALPVLIMLFFGAVDVTRYILIVQKTEKLAHSVANVTAQSASITQATLNQVLDASSDIMNPYPMGASGHIIVSSLYKEAGVSTTPTVRWRYEGGGTLAATSAIGAVGATPVMPTAFTFTDRENVIAAEVFYRFSPLLPNVWFGTTTIYRSAFYTPRFGALTSAPL